MGVFEPCLLAAVCVALRLWLVHSQPVRIDMHCALASLARRSATIQVGDLLDWLHHPRFAQVRDAVLAAFRRKEYHFRKVGTVVFLCGSQDSSPRNHLSQYLARHRRECLVFYAERAWEIIALHDTSANALAVEEKMAQLADIVIVIVESPGTFAELGAFSISPPLRRKLLPILDLNHRDGGSFVETGPVCWTDRDSTFGPSIWGNQARILEVVGDVEERLDRIPVARSRRVPDLIASPKHLLFFVCDLVSVFGPCPRHHIELFVETLLGQPGADVTLMLGLGRALDLLSSLSVDDQELFYRPLQEGQLRSFQYTGKYVDMASLRARVVGVMQACPPCIPALKALADAA